MTVHELLRWQYMGYAKFHRSRTNLMIHIVAVPIFLLCSAALVVSLLSFSWLAATLAIGFMAASIAIQGRGHGGEENPPEPFSGAANAVARIFLEQWITFPRFVLSGGWRRALNGSGISPPAVERINP